MYPIRYRSRGLVFCVLGTLLLTGCGSNGGSSSSGGIDFGTSYAFDKHKVPVIVGKRTTFHPGQPVVFVAHLSGKAGAHSLTFSLRGPGGAKTIPYSVRHLDSDTLANNLTPATLARLGVAQRGSYRVRFLRGSKTLANGTFTLKP